MHELCHAFHDQQLADGYQNMTLQTAYQRAMHLGLYHEVRVHTVEGMSADGSYTRALRGPLRGYCCNDVMEFFAELSVAFLCEEDVDFNKWEPCNRGQLQQRDPHTLRVLESLWAAQVQCP